MNLKKFVFVIFALIGLGLAGLFAQRLYGLHQEYQKYRDIETKSATEVRPLPSASVQVTPIDIEALTIKAPKSSNVTGVDQCVFSDQFHKCLEISKTKTNENDFGTTSFNFVIESCRTAAKDLSIRILENIPTTCRGQ